MRMFILDPLHYRNSTQLVEAAFDGDLEEVKAQLEKGEFTFHATHGSYVVTNYICYDCFCMHVYVYT